MADNSPTNTNEFSMGGKLLDKLPKVKAYEYDYGLGLAHKNAVQLAYEFASEYSKHDRDKTLSELLKIFDLWKSEHGVFPAYSYDPLSRRGQFIAALLGHDKTNNPPMPAKEYDLIVKAKKEKGEDIKIPDPWECCPYVSTPLGLFDKLWADNYSPLDLFIKENAHLFPLIKSVLIVLSNAITETHNTDCIQAAISLGKMHSHFQKMLIENMKPAAIKEFNRKRMQAEKKDIQKNETERVVLKCRQELLKEGKPFNHKKIAEKANVSLPQISRILRKNGIKSKK